MKKAKPINKKVKKVVLIVAPLSQLNTITHICRKRP